MFSNLNTNNQTLLENNYKSKYIFLCFVIVIIFSIYFLLNHFDCCCGYCCNSRCCNKKKSYTRI